MYIVIGILAGIIILQFIIMWKYQRQVKDICRQLAFMMKHDSNMLIKHEFDVAIVFIVMMISVSIVVFQKRDI